MAAESQWRAKQVKIAFGDVGCFGRLSPGNQTWAKLNAFLFLFFFVLSTTLTKINFE
jgi:hypothetical protein